MMDLALFSYDATALFGKYSILTHTHIYIKARPVCLIVTITKYFDNRHIYAAELLQLLIFIIESNFGK